MCDTWQTINYVGKFILNAHKITTSYSPHQTRHGTKGIEIVAEKICLCKFRLMSIFAPFNSPLVLVSQFIGTWHTYAINLYVCMWLYACTWTRYHWQCTRAQIHEKRHWSCAFAQNKAIQNETKNNKNRKNHHHPLKSKVRNSIYQCRRNRFNFFICTKNAAHANVGSNTIPFWTVAWSEVLMQTIDIRFDNSCAFFK